MADYAGGSVADYFSLMKPRVMGLVVLTALVGIVAAPGHIHPLIGSIALLAIAVGAGASGALNMWFDADIDAKMARTAARAIPRGKITAEEAFAFGAVLSVFSVLTLGMLVNYFAGAFLAFTIAFYLVIYTMWLKRRTPQNIVIGGAAGAFPPVIGWAAVTGSVDLIPMVMFAMIFIWTPPHFWSLALFANDDYRRAGVPMLPVVAGAKETRRQIALYTVLLVPVTLLPWVLGFSGPVYGVAAVALGAGFLVSVWRVATDLQDEAGVSLTNDAPARAAFKYSILYLFVLFAALAADQFTGRGP